MSKNITQIGCTIFSPSYRRITVVNNELHLFTDSYNPLYYVYNLDSHEWRSEKPIVVKHIKDVCNNGNDIHIISYHYTDSKFTSGYYVYDIVNKKYKRLSDLPIKFIDAIKMININNVVHFFIAKNTNIYEYIYEESNGWTELNKFTIENKVRYLTLANLDSTTYIHTAHKGMWNQDNILYKIEGNSLIKEKENVSRNYSAFLTNTNTSISYLYYTDDNPDNLGLFDYNPITKEITTIENITVDKINMFNDVTFCNTNESILFTGTDVESVRMYQLYEIKEVI